MKQTFRASELDRVLSCNGSITLVPLVAPREGDEGVEGVALHARTASRFVKELGASGDPGVEPACKTLKFSHWISDYYFRHVQETVPADYSLEVEAGLSYEFERFNLSGHIDCLALSPDVTEAIGFDLKTGYDAVDSAEMNNQLFGYICLLLRAYPTLKKATFWVVQPRNDEDDGFQRTSSVVIEGERFERALAVIEGQINAALDNRMEVSTSRTACKWCPAAIQCPAAKAERDFMKATLTPDLLAAIKREPDDKTLADWVISSKVLSRPFDDATDIAKARIAEAGMLVAGDGTVITVKIEAGAYKVPDAPAFMAALRTLLPTDDDIAKVVTFSQTRIKDRIAEVMQIPKTGTRAPVTAESVHAAHLRPLVEQGTRTKFQFA